MSKTNWYFHYTVTEGQDIVWTWKHNVSHKIYHTTWRPKAENIDIITKDLSTSEKQSIRESIKLLTQSIKMIKLLNDSIASGNLGDIND